MDDAVYVGVFGLAIAMTRLHHERLLGPLLKFIGRAAWSPLTVMTDQPCRITLRRRRLHRGTPRRSGIALNGESDFVSVYADIAPVLSSRRSEWQAPAKNAEARRVPGP
jgi:hypothetical protein